MDFFGETKFLVGGGFLCTWENHGDIIWGIKWQVSKILDSWEEIFVCLAEFGKFLRQLWEMITADPLSS